MATIEIPEMTAEAARLLRGVLAAVEAGEIEAKTGQAKAMLRRIEGATAALESLSGS